MQFYFEAQIILEDGSIGGSFTGHTEEDAWNTAVDEANVCKGSPIPAWIVSFECTKAQKRKESALPYPKRLLEILKG